MNKPSRSRKFSAKQSARLGAYLAAGLGASTAATPVAEAAIVNIDIGPTGFDIGGINGGADTDSSFTIHNFPFVGAGGLYVGSLSYALGLGGRSGLEFAINGGNTSPRNFAFGDSISGPALFSDNGYFTLFGLEIEYAGFYISPDFGPSSYMGFKTAQGNYGWLEVTWVSKSSQFQILSGAYEDQVGVAILAGATAPIPEPGTWVALAVFAGGAAFARWRKRRDEAA